MKILIVEDEPKVASFLKTGLEETSTMLISLMMDYLRKNLRGNINITFSFWI
jgi:hypothetical protein